MTQYFKNKTNVLLGISLSLIVSALAGISSCSSEFDDINEEPSEVKLPLSFNTEVNYSSKIQNPYDFIGQYHNDGLQSVINEYKSTPSLKGTNSKESVIKNLTKSFVKNNKFENYNSAISISDEYVSVVADNVLDKSIDKVRLKSGTTESLSVTQRKFFDKIKEILFNRTITSPQVLVDKINDVEADIMTTKLMTDDEKGQILIASAVAKYSSIFWIQFMLEKGNLSIKSTMRLKSGTVETGDPFSDWYSNVFLPNAATVVEGDFIGAAQGAITGLIFGGSAGSIAPGVGTVTVGISGAMVGGATGAIVGSAWEGISILFSLF